MNKISTVSTIAHSAIAVLIVGSAFAMTNADAKTIRAHFITATAACAGPIPSSDGALRRSPLGIRNQGTSNVFISCSVPTDFVGDMNAGFVEASFANFGATDVTVNCTLTAGNREYGFGSVAGWTTVTAGSNGSLYWLDIDKVDYWGSQNFSCILPPNVELNTIQYRETDTGNEL